MYVQCVCMQQVKTSLKNTLEKVFSYKKKNKYTIMTYLPDLGRQLIAINWGKF